MTDRISHMVIVLEKDMRDDDAKELADAVQRMRGVQSVKLGPAVDMNERVARARVKRQLLERLLDICKDDEGL